MEYDLKLKERGGLEEKVIGCVRVQNEMPQAQAEREIQGAFAYFCLNRIRNGGNFVAYLEKCWPGTFSDAKSALYATATILVN